MNFEIGDRVNTTFGLVGEVVEKFGDYYKVTGQDGAAKFSAIFSGNYLELIPKEDKTTTETDHDVKTVAPTNDGVIYYDPEDEVAYKNFESFKEEIKQFGVVEFGNTHGIYFDSWFKSRDYAPSVIFFLSDGEKQALLDEYFDYVVNEYWNENMIEIDLY